MTEETEIDPEETENENMNTIRMTYDPTRDNMSEIVLVEGIDESYKSPETFKIALKYEHNYITSKCRESIKKELENMEKKKVWRITSKDKFSADGRLLGTK